jgi:hypothetical protein
MHHWPRTMVSGQQPGQGGEHGAVSPVRPRAGDLTSQHRDLVPEDQDHHVLCGVTPSQEHQSAEWEAAPREPVAWMPAL